MFWFQNCTIGLVLLSPRLIGGTPGCGANDQTAATVPGGELGGGACSVRPQDTIDKGVRALAGEPGHALVAHVGAGAHKRSAWNVNPDPLGDVCLGNAPPQEFE